MAKKLNDNQKKYNALLKLRYHAAGRIAVYEERLNDAREELNGLDKQLADLRSPARQALELNESEKAQVRAGQIIQAIKEYRGRHLTTPGQFIGLKEAKDKVDEYAYQCGVRTRPGSY
jgi:ribosomal protein L7/L12